MKKRNRLFLMWQLIIFLIILIVFYFFTNKIASTAPGGVYNDFYKDPSQFEVHNFLSEAVQDSFIVASLFIILYFRKLFKKIYKPLSINLRIAILSIILYEEISHITRNNAFFQINNHSEFNLHNSYFLNESAINNIPLFGDVSWMSLITLLFPLSLAISANLKIFQGWITFRRKYSFLLLLPPANIIFTTLMRSFGFITDPTRPFVDNEIIELIFYTLILLDSLEHIIVCKKTISNKI